MATVLSNRADGAHMDRDPEAPPESMEFRSFNSPEAVGDNVGYSTSDSDVFHADKHCPHIRGERVIAIPISRHWDALRWYHKPCDHCTIERERFDELVLSGAIPECEDDRWAGCQLG